MGNTYQNLNSNGVLFQDVISVIEDVRNYLQFLNETGCKGFECSKESIEKINHWKVKGQGAWSRSQESGVRSQKPEVRNQKSEVRSQKSEIRSQKSEIRNQKSEIRNQKSEIRNQKPDTIEIIQKEIENCRLCKIADDRKHLIFGGGSEGKACICG